MRSWSPFYLYYIIPTSLWLESRTEKVFSMLDLLSRQDSNPTGQAGRGYRSCDPAPQMRGARYRCTSVARAGKDITAPRKCQYLIQRHGASL